MSERKKLGAEPEREQDEQDDFDAAVIAADDTGLIRNEADIEAVEESEGGL